MIFDYIPYFLLIIVLLYLWSSFKLNQKLAFLCIYLDFVLPRVIIMFTQFLGYDFVLTIQTQVILGLSLYLLAALFIFVPRLIKGSEK